MKTGDIDSFEKSKVRFISNFEDGFEVVIGNRLWTWTMCIIMMVGQGHDNGSAFVLLMPANSNIFLTV